MEVLQKDRLYDRFTFTGIAKQLSNQLLAAVHVSLPKQMYKMHMHRLRRDLEPMCDLFVREPLDQASCHVVFPIAQVLGVACSACQM